MKQVSSLLVWHLFTDCPECGHSMDLADMDEENDIGLAIFSNKWADLTGYEVDCPRCECRFELEGVEY